MSDQRTIKVECFRFDPEVDSEPYYQTFEVPLVGQMSVHDCLIYIRENLDPSLAFFLNCKRGVCGRCTMRINGKSGLACIVEATGDIRVEPIRRDGIVRDLWVESI